MKFPTQFTKHDRVNCSSGSRIKTIYEGSIDENGVLVLLEKGKKDIYQEIQADKELCDINIIVAKYTLGDTSVLERVQSAYGDFTELPKTLAGVYDMVVKADAAFDKLPADIRAEFNNSPSEFLAAVGSERFKKAFSPYMTNSGSKVEEPAPANERSDVNE